MDRLDRIKEVYEYLNSHDEREAQFADLYAKLLYEIKIEEVRRLPNNLYLNDLNQTKSKQGDYYLSMRSKYKKKSCFSEFRDFVINFRSDLLSEIVRLEHAVE